MNKKKLLIIIAAVLLLGIAVVGVLHGISFLGNQEEVIAEAYPPYINTYSNDEDYPHSDAVTIDGKLDEDIWQNKKWFTNTTTDNLKGTKPTFYVTATQDEYGIYIASKSTDANVLDMSGVTTAWTFHLGVAAKGEEANGANHRVFVDVQGNIYRTMINVQRAYEVLGDINSGATEGAVVEMFISWKALNIDVSEGLPEYFSMEFQYHFAKDDGSGLTTINTICNDHNITSRFFRFDVDGYINADKEGAVLGDTIFGLGKTSGWDLTQLDEGIVRTTFGESHNRIYFKEYGSDFLIETTIIPVQAMGDAFPRAGIVLQDAGGVYIGIFLDEYDDILTSGLNGTKNMDKLHIITISNNNGSWNQQGPKGGYRDNPIAETTEGTKLTVLKHGSKLYYFVNDVFFYAEDLDYISGDVVPGLMTIGSDSIFKDSSCKTVTSDEVGEYLAAHDVYSVSVKAGVGGSATAPIYVEKGGSYDLSITCKSGYEVESILINGVEKIADAIKNAKNGVYTVKNATGNQKIEIKFKKNSDSTISGSFIFDEAVAGKNVDIIVNGITNPLLHYEIAANPTKGYTVSLPNGKYTLSVSKEDYMYISATVTANGEVTQDFKLVPSAFKWNATVNGYTVASHIDHWDMTQEINGVMSTSYALGGKQAPMFFKGSGTDFVAKATINYTTNFTGDGSQYQPDLFGGFNFHVGNQEAYIMAHGTGLNITGFQFVESLVGYSMLTYPDKLGVDLVVAKSGNDVRVYINGVEAYKTTWVEVSGGMDPEAEYIVGLYALMDKTSNISFTNYSVNFDSDYAKDYIASFKPQWKTITSLSQITNPAGLYRLAGDIKGNTTTVKNFVGQLDCKGYTIETSVPLFDKLVGATVKDLNLVLTKSITAEGVLARTGCNMTLTNISVSGSSGVVLTAPAGKDVGGLLGNMYVGQSSTIKNCTNALTVNNPYEGYGAGGLVGFAEEWDSYFIGCRNTGTVTAVTHAGGIVGRCNKYNVVFSGCVNDGTVTSQQDAGGIMGYCMWAEADKPQKVIGCTNNGTVTGLAAGGMVGRSADDNLRITECVNNGTVAGEGDNNRAGGLLGHLQNASAIIEGCTNGKTGLVTAVNAGGAIGYKDGTGVITVNGCTNNGEVCGSATSGGCLGYAIGYGEKVYIGTYEGQGCVNNGHVYGNGAEVWAGGIIGGLFQTTTEIESAVNNGTVDSADRAGGIVGFIYEGEFAANGCENKGAVSGTNYTGDIFGIVHMACPNIDGLADYGCETDWNGYGYMKALSHYQEYQKYGTDGETTIFVGDSFFDKDFWSTFHIDLAGKDALCLGVGGCVAVDWINYINNHIFLYDIAPKNIVFSVGNNDLHGGNSAEEYLADMQQMLTTVHTVTPDSQIYVFSVTPRTGAQTNSVLAEANKLVQDWCDSQGSWVVYLDISDEMDTDKLSDGVHPKTEYYESVYLAALLEAGCVLSDGNSTADRAEPISSLAELNGQSGSYYLTGDIVDNITTVVNFTGMLDGRGYTVSTSVPLFEDLSRLAYVKNLNILLTEDMNAQGALAAYAVNATVENVHVSGASVIGTSGHTGGLIGQADNCVVINCSNACNVIGTTSGYTGGIVGCVGGASGSTYSGCTNTGEITTAGANAGGIVGRIDWATGVVITSCSNTGAITAGNEGAGGILGMVAFSTGGEIIDCSNAGTVTNTNEYGNAGGMAGLVGNNSDMRISGCTNSGAVIAWAAGGMVGRDMEAELTVSDCVNNAAITGQGDDNRAGGMVGHAQNASATIESCTNSASAMITAVNAGGMLGFADGTGTITINGCTNDGDICGTGKSGGILGYAVGYGKQIYVGTCDGQGCVNNGHIYGDATVTWAGGMIGGLFQTVTKVESAVSNGNVDTAERAGGIVGFIYEGKFTANDCVVTGTVSGTNYTGTIYGTLHNMVPNIDGSAGDGYDDGELAWDGFGLAAAAERYNTYAANGNDGSSTIFVGDSFQDPGFWTTFNTDFEGKDALCLGIGGSTAEDWINYIEQQVFLYDIAPKNTVFHLGNNDIHNDWDVDKYLENMKKLLTAYHEISPNTKVYTFSTTHRTGATDTNALVDIANPLMKAWCEEQGDWLTFVDISTIVTTDMLYDGIHPQVRYYGELIVPTLLEAGLELEDEVEAVATPITSLLEITNKQGEYYLTGDITGNTVTVAGFTGTLDGNGYTVYTSVPLFETLSGTIVKNLNIVLTADITATSDYGTGALAYYALGATVTNVKISGDYAVCPASGKAGGFVGKADNAAFTDCVNEVDVIGTDYTGGFVGIIGGASGTSFTGCTNTGDITTTGANAGGIAGRMDWAQNVTFTDCVNTGTITAASEGAGGILGMAAFSGGTNQMTDCRNEGTVISTNTSEGIAGGIAGQITHSSTMDIAGCSNTGTVIGAESTSFNCISGGILGRTFGSDKVTVTQCVNDGSVYGAMAGGIVGMVWESPVTLIGNTNNGTVVAYGEDAAGIAGRIQNGSTVLIEDCVNNGVIAGTANVQQLNSYAHTPDGTVVTWSGSNLQNGSTETSKTVTYTGLDGAAHTNPSAYAPSAADSFVLTDPESLENYVFVGWYIGQQQVTTLEGQTGNVTLEARWEAANGAYSITYLGLEGALHTNPAVYTEDAASGIVLADPEERAGYIFRGWYIGDREVTSLDGCTGDLTIVARWAEKGTELPIVPFSFSLILGRCLRLFNWL